MSFADGNRPTVPSVGPHPRPGIPFAHDPSTMTYRAVCPTCRELVGYVTDEAIAAGAQRPRFARGHACKADA